jgi:secreted trypsin-like serine protease
MSARRRLFGLPVLLAALLLPLVLGAGPAAAIANGVAATPGQYPFAVRLIMPSIPSPGGGTYSSACSGALVAPSWIITAGHCFHDVNRNRVSGPVPYATTATLNTVNVNQYRGETLSVLSVQQSPSNDIALARLSAPVTDVVPLALRTTRPAAGQLVGVAGWGATSSVNPAPSPQLYYGVTRIGGATTTTVLVTGYSPSRTTSACLYDSGAPYFTTGSPPLLTSVENTGPDCPHSSWETTARVDVVGTWIRSVVSQ